VQLEGDMACNYIVSITPGPDHCDSWRTCLRCWYNNWTGSNILRPTPELQNRCQMPLALRGKTHSLWPYTPNPRGTTHTWWLSFFHSISYLVYLVILLSLLGLTFQLSHIVLKILSLRSLLARWLFTTLFPKAQKAYSDADGLYPPLVFLVHRNPQSV
jgi:hypothetical protein